MTTDNRVMRSRKQIEFNFWVRFENQIDKQISVRIHKKICENISAQLWNQLGGELHWKVVMALEEVMYL